MKQMQEELITLKSQDADGVEEEEEADDEATSDEEETVEDRLADLEESVTDLNNRLN